MTTEELAYIVPAVVAIVVVALTIWSQVTINRQNLSNQRKLARQERVRLAYEELLLMVRWVMEIVDAANPILDYQGREQPDQPDMERVRAGQAKIGVHGSDDVKAILKKWIDCRTDFFVASNILDSMKEKEKRGIDVEKSYGNSIPEQWKAVVDRRRDLWALVNELEDKVSAELRE